MALLELFISRDKYLDRINQLDTQLDRLRRIYEDYSSHLEDLQNKVMDGEDDNYQRMYNNAEQELKAMKIQIQNAQTCRGILQKTVDEMDENQTLVEGVLEDVLNTTGNAVSIAADAANIAATAAEVAVIL